MKPRIEILQEKKLIGLHLEMSIINNRTGELWRQFGPRIKEITNRVSQDKISLQVYPTSYHKRFNPNIYKGSSADNSIFQYIYGQWLPNSNYLLDDKPHFEVLGEKYKNNDPNSEEEIWIPIKDK